MTPASVDIGEAIDRGGWTWRQKAILLLVGGAIVFDGFDNQVVGLAAPALLRDWGISKAALAPVLAVSQVGMFVGMVFGGGWGDRAGRKPLLVASLLVFGIATLVMAAAGGLATLALCRIVAGIGIGAAIPNAAALIAEYTPARRRSFAVAASIVCVPLGGVVGGMVAAAVLPGAGWRALFALGGGLPLAAAAIVWLAVPESARHLLARAGDGARVRAALARAGVPVPPVAALTDAHRAPVDAGGSIRLLGPAYRRDTLALWVAYAGCSLAIYTGFNWLPVMLADAGFDLARASTGLTAFNLGGVAAALLGAWTIAGAGSRWPMLLTAGFGVLVALALAALLLRPDAPGAMVAWLGLLGASANGGQTMLYALAAGLYPPRIRATGVGAAAGVGRLGALSSSFLGSAALSLLGERGFFVLMAAALAITGVALGAIRRHLAPTRVDASPG